MKSAGSQARGDSQESQETVQLQSSPVVSASSPGPIIQATPVKRPSPRVLTHWGARQKNGINFNPEGTTPLACGFLSSAESVPGQETIERRAQRYASFRERRDHDVALKTHSDEQQAMYAEAVVHLEARVDELSKEVSRLKHRVNYLLQYAPPHLAGGEEEVGSD
jgi:hypothetical protein